MIKLSICIPTYCRADFIVETLDSIVPQLTPEMELLILDGASPDHTEQVVRQYTKDKPFIRYCREPTKASPDADFDKAVEYASGEYCWLFPDDDLLAPGAVSRVMAALDENPDLLVVDAQVMDLTLTQTLSERRLNFSGERRYTAADGDRLMADTADPLSFIGCAIVRRSLWLSRDRKTYYGTCFLHVGVIFQRPIDRAIAIGEPLIRIRYANSIWTPRRFEIWGFKWPELISGFDGFSEEAKGNAGGRYPWRHLKHLFSFRARGAYSYAEYLRFFRDRDIGWWRMALVVMAVFPAPLAHVLGTTFFLMTGQINSYSAYELVRTSPHSNWLSRWLASGASWSSLPSTAR